MPCGYIDVTTNCMSSYPRS